VAERDALHAAGRLTPADKHKVSSNGLREIVLPALAALAAWQPITAQLR
jgi:hypothetical protein